MCAPISATVGGSVSSLAFATSLMLNQVLAAVTILAFVGYKIVKIAKFF